MENDFKLNERVTHLETIVSSVATKVDNVQSDISALTSSVEKLVTSKQPNWGVVGTIGALIVMIVVGYWALAKQPYDMAISNLDRRITTIEEDVKINTKLLSRMDERTKFINGKDYTPVQ